MIKPLKKSDALAVYVACGMRGCGRFTLKDSVDWEWWLSGDKFGGDPLVVRCPQHITEWTMRLAGLGRGMGAYRFKRMAQENDPYDELQRQGLRHRFLFY